MEQTKRAPVIRAVTPDNLAPDALDGFVRTQTVTQVYRRIGGEYRLVERLFVDDWSAARKREKAAELRSGDYTAFGAWDGPRIVGFIALEKVLRGDRLVVSSLHVSREYRGSGLGRRLFRLGLEEGRRLGARALYISACSARETVGFYRAMGCLPAEPVIASLAEAEPCDLQLVCPVAGEAEELSGFSQIL